MPVVDGLLVGGYVCGECCQRRGRLPHTGRSDCRSRQDGASRDIAPRQPLAGLREAMPRNTLVMQQLVRTSVRLRDGKALLVLGPALRKEKALPLEQIDALEKEAARW